MNPATFTFLLPGLAVGLDLALGDPFPFHPVRLFGWLIHKAEGFAPQGPAARFWYGALCVSFLASASALTASVLPKLLPAPLSLLCTLYLAYAGLALGDLRSQSRRVAELIDQGRIEEARIALSWLVSRDTAAMDEADLRRSLAETLSENLCDGFTAPFFYLCLGGVPLLWAYKAVSTFDSMWGYPHEPYRLLGRFAARADDVAAFVPARLTAVVVWLGGLICGRLERASLGRIRKQALRMKSPNAGWPMAALAWFTGAGMGGPTSYQGVMVDKPLLGPKDQPFTIEKTRLLERSIFWVSMYFVIIIYTFRIFLE